MNVYGPVPQRVWAWCEGSYLPPASKLALTDLAGICSVCRTPHILSVGVTVGHYRRDLAAEVNFKDISVV